MLYIDNIFLLDKEYGQNNLTFLEYWIELYTSNSKIHLSNFVPKNYEIFEEESIRPKVLNAKGITSKRVLHT